MPSTSGGVVCRPVLIWRWRRTFWTLLMIATLKITMPKYQHCKFYYWRWLFLFSFAVNVNEERIIAFLTEKCCYLSLRSKVLIKPDQYKKSGRSPSPRTQSQANQVVYDVRICEVKEKSFDGCWKWSVERKWWFTCVRLVESEDEQLSLDRQTNQKSEISTCWDSWNLSATG